MAAESIGRCRCPVCKSDRAKLTLAKSQLPVLTCNGCNLQIFARSFRSDELLRARLVPEAAPAVATEIPAPAVRETPPAPVRTAPAPINQPEPVRTAPVEPAPVQAATSRPAWGLGAFR